MMVISSVTEPLQISHPPKQRRRLSAPPMPSSPGEGRAAFTLKLWNVVAERGEQHVVHGLGRNAHCRRDAVVARPPGLGDVGVLDAPTHSALRSGIDLVPEADSAFGDSPDVAGAGSAAARQQLCGWRILGAASAVVGEWRSVATELVEVDASRLGSRTGVGGRGC